LAIVLALRRAEARVVDLTVALGLSQSTVSNHLECLRCCGLVESRAVGRASIFSIAEPGIEHLLAAAEAVLDETGNAVALCPTYGAPES
jgi:DNA-binding transcriptional ArsR family regulator